MNKKQLKEKVLSKLIERVLLENQPATKPDKEVETKPGTPNTDKPEPKRRDLKPKDPKTLPDGKPKAHKKGLNEKEMLNKIVDRFKSKKK